MKNIILSLVLFISFNAFANEESITDKRLLVEQLLEVSDMRHAYEMSIDATIQQLSQNPSFSGEDFREIMETSLNWNDISEMVIDIYAETFTKDEINGLIAFYETPTGKAFIYKTPQVTAKAALFMQNKTAKILQNIKAKMDTQQLDIQE